MSCGLHLLRPLHALPRSIAPRRCMMPLRAKITDSAFGARRTMASEASVPGPLPTDEADDVLFHTIYGARTIELNRPKKLNTLNGSMARKILPRLKEWEYSDMASVIILKGAGEKALCAGGDVAVLADWNREGREGQQRSQDYFALEYKLDHVIATLSKPYVAFMDGITMGGGVGLSVHAPLRIATERTRLAMPETDIGFFPDVGASFFLPRLDGKMGAYLALTGENITGVDAFYNGFATHYMHSSALPDLENRLAELVFPDYFDLQHRLDLINKTIEEFNTGLPHDQPMKFAGEMRRAIDECFSADTVEGIISRLEAKESQAGGVGEWATATLKRLATRSPTSLKVTLKQMFLGRTWSIAEAFDREYNIASVFMAHHDFTEGVSAKLIRKEKGVPKWQPSTLDAVSQEDVDRFFANPEGQERLVLLKSGLGTAYHEYPHARLALPSQAAVREYVLANADKPKRAVVHHFLQAQDGKQGVREKVTEILDRMTSARAEGGLRWESAEKQTGA